MKKTTVTKADKRDKVVLNIDRTLCYIVLAFLAFLCLFFFYVLIINTTRAHPDIQKGFSFLPGKSFLSNLKSLLNDANLPVLSGLMNSTIVSAGSALLAVYFSAITAYAIHAYNFRFKKLAFTFILLIMMVPTQVSALGFVNLMSDMGLLNSLIPLIVPSIASPIVFFFIKQYMDSVLPIELIEAARIDGAHEFRIFNQIVIPLMKPAIAVQAIFTFVSSWNNYFIPSLLINKPEKKTLPILMGQLRSADFLKFDMGKLYMCIAFGIVPVLIIYLCLSKFIVRGVTLGSVKG
jgi:multiple sugar transport system permease protein